MVDIFIDLEWNRNNKIFLFGYAYNLSAYYYLADADVNANNIAKILQPVTGFVYFYGPDVGVIKTQIGLDLRNYFMCVNLLTVFRYLEPFYSSYKLSELEKLYALPRSVYRYKSNIFTIYNDWQKPNLRSTIIQYNKDDVFNLIRLKRKIFAQNNFTRNKAANFAT